MDKSVQPQGRFALALFCDDIRLEVGNKVTLVGLYSGHMFLSELPAFIPKLGVAIMINSPIDEPFESLSIRIERGKDVLLTFSPEVVTQLNAPGLGQEEPSRASLTVNIGLPPLTISEPCTLRAIAVIDGSEIVAGKLHIGKQPAPDSRPSPTGSPDAGA